MRLRLGKVTVADVLAAQPVTTNLLKFMRASFFFSSRRRHTRFDCDWSSDVCSSDLDDPVRDGCDGGQAERLRSQPTIDAGAARGQLYIGEIGRASCRERV